MESLLIPNKNELYATCVACIGMFLSGVGWTFSAGLIGQLRDIKITVENQSLIGSINMYACAISYLIFTYCSKIIGRKDCLLLALICNIIAWLLMYFFSFSMIVVYISRAFSGFAAGMELPCCLYITETGHKARRGILMSIFGLSISLGITLTYVIQYFSSWQTVALVSLIVSAVGFIQTCFLKETKYWYLYKNNIEKAKESMKWFDSSLTEAEIQADIDEILASESLLKDTNASFIGSLKSRTNFRCFMYGLLLFTFLVGCGHFQITAYPYNYYIHFQLPVTYSTLTLIQGILELLMSVVCSLTVDLIPRRRMLHICCWIMNACLVATLFQEPLVHTFGLIGQWVLVVALMTFYGLACGFLLCLTNLIVTEVVFVTTEARSILLGVLYFWCTLVTAVYTQVFPHVLIAVPISYVAFFFIINLALLSLTGFFVPETRGTALHLCSTG